MSGLDAFAALGNAPAAPKSFLEFCSAIGVRLTATQRVLAKVAFDGADPKDLHGNERGIARLLFGDVARFSPESRHVVVAVCGARAGKSYVLSALRMLHLALIVPLTTLAPGELAVALIVAPDKRLARQVLRYALGAARGNDAIRRRMAMKSADGFVLRRDDGLVAVEVLPATRGGSAVRGRSLVGAVLDECAFFRDESYQVNDTEVFRAIAPRILRGGQLILASTPWAEQGLLWDFHSKNHGHPIDAVSAHAPTLLMRDDEHTRAYVTREQDRDPANAAREFGAEFMATAGEAFFDAEAIKQSTDESLVLPVDQGHRVPSVGADMGFRSDSAALVVTLRDDALITVASILEKRPEPKKPLKPSAVVAEFAGVMKGYGAGYVIADSHYRESIQEHMEEHGLLLTTAPEGAQGKADVYTAVRIKMNEGRIRLPNHERFIRQLKEVRARPLSGGAISIMSPRWRTGGHGDIVAAFVLAAWDSARQMPAKPPPVFSTRLEAEAAAWEARIQANIAKAATAELEMDGFGPDAVGVG